LQLVTSEFSNIASLMPATGAPTPVGSKQKAGGSKPIANSRVGAKLAVPLSSKDFKRKYNEIVKTRTDDAECDRAFAGKELK
jgi:hypothetical protein